MKHLSGISFLVTVFASSVLPFPIIVNKDNLELAKIVEEAVQVALNQEERCGRNSLLPKKSKKGQGNVTFPMAALAEFSDLGVKVKQKTLEYMDKRASSTQHDTQFPFIPDVLLIQFAVCSEQRVSRIPLGSVSILSMGYGEQQRLLLTPTPAKWANTTQEFMFKQGWNTSGYVKEIDGLSTKSIAIDVIKTICADPKVLSIIVKNSLRRVGYTQDTFFGCLPDTNLPKADPSHLSLNNNRIYGVFMHYIAALGKA